MRGVWRELFVKPRQGVQLYFQLSLIKLQTFLLIHKLSPTSERLSCHPPYTSDGPSSSTPGTREQCF